MKEATALCRRKAKFQQGEAGGTCRWALKVKGLTCSYRLQLRI
jgi:hypothetical protein